MNFEGKVVVVTGAGGGLGESHARAFAERGASVVVNDPGVNRDGLPADTNEGEMRATQVADKIKATGGKALADFSSVTEVEQVETLFKNTISEFGRLDIVINNAGILRDKSLAKMTDMEFDEVLNVHLRGTFLCSRWACQYFKQRYNEEKNEDKSGGVIINTTSTSGLLGNFGQSNYGAAKAGIAGLTRTVALEMARYKVRVNAIAPIANTRMTADLAGVPDSFAPEKVSPLLVYLSSEAAANVSGRIFGAAGGLIQEYYIETSKGVDLGSEEFWTAEKVAENWASIVQKRSSKVDAALKSSLTELMEKSLPAVFQADKAEGFETRIHFKTEAGDWTAEVQKSALRMKAGLSGHPSAVVEAEGQTLLQLMKGEVDPITAFSSGKLKLQSPEIVARFQSCFS